MHKGPSEGRGSFFEVSFFMGLPLMAFGGVSNHADSRELLYSIILITTMLTHSYD